MEKVLDVSFNQGDALRPFYVFIHGLGMDKSIWVAPEQARVFAGSYPASILLCSVPAKKEVLADTRVSRLIVGDPPRGLDTLFKIVSQHGASALAFTLRRPANYVAFALEDLSDVLSNYVDYTRNGVVLVGHSRGGVIARAFAQKSPENVRALITLGAPHGGSALASWADAISKLTGLLLPYLDENERGTLKSTIRRLLSFIGCKAVHELQPGSDFLRGLSATAIAGVRTISVTGTKPSLLTLYKVNTLEGVPVSGYKTLTYKRLLSFPDSLVALMPGGVRPPELTNGKGDALVSVEHSRLPCAVRYLTYHLNHFEILFNEHVHKDIVGELLQAGLL